MGSFHRLNGLWLIALLGLALDHSANAAISASATYTSQQLGPNSYEYSVKLKNTGTTPIGTLWLGWVPFYDLLPSAPTAITSPSGWTGVNAPDLFGTASVQWVNTTTPLAAGQTLGGFKFDTPDAPAAIGGTSFFAGFPVLESYVYIAGPQTDAGFALAPTVQTPEPTCLGLLLVTPSFLLMRRRRH